MKLTKVSGSLNKVSRLFYIPSPSSAQSYKTIIRRSHCLFVTKLFVKLSVPWEQTTG